MRTVIAKMNLSGVRKSQAAAVEVLKTMLKDHKGRRDTKIIREKIRQLAV